MHEHNTEKLYTSDESRPKPDLKEHSTYLSEKTNQQSSLHDHLDKKKTLQIVVWVRNPLKILRLRHSMSVLIFLTSTCSISWLFINHCEWRLLGFPRHASLRDRPSWSLDFRWWLCMDSFQVCKIVEDHHNKKIVDFDRLPQFMQIMLRFGAPQPSVAAWVPRHLMHKCRRWYNVVYRSGGSGNALNELLNYLEAIKNQHICTSSCWSFWPFFGNEMMRLWQLSIILENSLILFMYCLSLKILVRPIATLW